MKYSSFLPLLFFLVIGGSFFYQVLFQGRLPIAADTIVGLYHPFRDTFVKEYPNGIPFKNFLITDPVRQQYPWRMLSIQSLDHLSLPLWNPYSGAGTPLLANFQSAVFYPLNILFFILPFSLAWSSQVMLQVILSGFFLYLYLRQMKLGKLPALFGGIAFAFSGFSVAWLTWNTIGHVALWLPVILLAQEKLLSGRSKRWFAVLFFAEVAAVFAGHVQTLFYLTLLSGTYLFFRVLQLSWKKGSFSKTLQIAFRMYIPFLLVGICAVIFTAIQWLPTLFFIHEAARALDQADWQNPGWFLPWQHLIQFIAPDFFGNPSTLNYWGEWNYAEFVGYIGIVPLLMGFYALFFRKDKKTAFFGTVFFLSLIFSLPTFFAKIPFLLSIPFLSSAQPTRLLFLTDFSLAVLAGLGLDFFLSRKRQILHPVFFLAASIGILWSVGLIFYEQLGITAEQALIIQSNLKLPLIIFVLSLLCLLTLFIVKNNNHREKIFLVLILITVFDLIRFGWKFTPFSSSMYLYPDTKITKFLQTDKTIYRIMTTDNRIFPPNFSTQYKIQSVDIYDPLYLRRYGEFIAAIERSSANIKPPFGFNRIITPHNFESPLINLLNVKYIISLSDIRSKRFQKVLQEGQTEVFENKDVLPRAFFVENIVLAADKEASITQLFKENMDLRKTAVVELSSSQGKLREHFSVGDVKIIDYTENRILIRTQNTGEGFLFFADTFDPIWEATIRTADGVKSSTEIYRTNFTFRGIIVPPGKNEVEIKASIL